MKKGLVIGKFYPPHNGHHFLINTALEHSDVVDVLVCDNQIYRIPAATRAKWLERIHPRARIKIIPDLDDDDNSKAWADHTVKFLGYKPDTVFSSEDYGDKYALYMHAAHFAVDKKRLKIPICATKIRANVLMYWEYMHPLVRAAFARRVCVLGSESTGTTTLSQDLAKHYSTVWAPEYGRYYSEGTHFGLHEWDHDDFQFIATQQKKIENRFAGLSNGLLICDTNAFATRLWEKRYLHRISSKVDVIGRASKVDLYVITDVNIPFVQDGFRDGESVRHAMHEQFISEVKATGVPYMIASGSIEKRKSMIVDQIDSILRQRVTI